MFHLKAQNLSTPSTNAGPSLAPQPEPENSNSAAVPCSNLSPNSADELRPSAHEVITRVRAIAPSTSTKPHSLSFKEGDMIEVLDNRERFRWKGRFEDRTGYFSPHCVVSKLSILVSW
jgi:hypothetical protein